MRYEGVALEIKHKLWDPPREHPGCGLGYMFKRSEELYIFVPAKALKGLTSMRQRVEFVQRELEAQ